MQHSFYHRLSHFLWVAIVLALVVLAAYVSLGRVLMANLGSYQQALLDELNLRLPFTVRAQRVRGEWESFTPFFVLEGLRLSFPGSDEAPLQLSAGRVGIDVWSSLRTRSLQVTSVALDDLTLRGELTPQRRFRLIGFGAGSVEGDAWLRSFLLNVEQVNLRRSLLRLAMPAGEEREFDLNLWLRRQGGTRVLEAGLTSTRGARIAVLAQGVGDPLRPDAFTGDVYLDIRTADLAAARELVGGGAPPLEARGELSLELWLTLRRGNAAVEASLDARDLVVSAADGSWQFPLQRLAMRTHVVEERDRWTVYASDVVLEQPDVALRLPRVQLDAWGSALQVRAADLPLAALTEFTARSASLPSGLRDLAAGLDLSGRLTALQVSLGDVAQPAADWEVEANFEEVALASYRGAPGAAGVRGYAHLVPGRGQIVVDARGAVLALPKVYRRPLDFDTLHGTLDLDWNDRRIALRSGLVTATAPEGVAHALFALNIPRLQSASGVEMELLVGLADTAPEYREKYLPHGLNPALLGWLSDALGAGTINEGAFLWRGSLQRAARDRRTVQLAFDVSDFELNYHPDWPPVTLGEGMALVDDTRVSIWGQRAQLLDSTVENLSVETWLDDRGHLALALSAGVRGPIADGLAVLRTSPLGDLLNHALDDWKMRGTLHTELDARLSLAGAAPPEVAVRTRWQDVDVDIRPGELPLRGLHGDLSYDSASGFHSAGFAGELWGNALRLGVEQQPAEHGAYGPAKFPVDVILESTVSLADLRAWLQLDQLAFASGAAPVRVALRIAPGAAPLLTAESALRGVRLDLPDPWGKEAGAARRLRLHLPLATDAQRLSLSLEDQLHLDLDLAGGGLRGAALGLGAAPPPLEPGAVRVAGHTPLLQVEQWLDFASRHFGGAAPPAAGGGGGAADLQLRVEGLSVASLSFFGQTLVGAELSLASLPGGWSVALDTDWLRGSALLDTAGGRSRVELSHLDVSRLADYRFPVLAGAGAGNTAEEAGRAPLDLPPTDVVVEDIVHAGRRLGGLSFAVYGAGGDLFVDGLRGELAHLRLGAENPGALRWQTGPGERTRVQTRLNFDDIGATLHHFGYERVVETERGAVDVDLQWPGSPAAFALAEASGSLRLDVGAGRFPEAPSGASGALRVVSILNLVDLVQRLSLAHMFESGIPFDSLSGEVRLRSGVIEVPSMAIRGGSSFQFSGSSTVAARQLQGELVATIPVAQNLPWVAALAAGLPVAAGVFVVSRLFDEQMNRLTSGVYRIDGSWDDPRVRFDRIFDDTARPPADPPQAQPWEGAPARDAQSDHAAEVSRPDAGTQSANGAGGAVEPGTRRRETVPAGNP